MRNPRLSSENVFGAAAIRRTRVATCAAKAPTKTTTSSQSSSVDIYGRETKRTRSSTSRMVRLSPMVRLSRTLRPNFSP